MGIYNIKFGISPSGDIDAGELVHITVIWTGPGISYEFRVFFGDNTFETRNVDTVGTEDEIGTFASVFSHVYSEGGTFNVLVEIFGGVDFDNGGTTITVLSVPPSITSATGLLNGSTGLVELTVTFDDPGDNSFTGTIQWGDGVITTHNITDVGNEHIFEVSYIYTTYFHPLGHDYRRNILVTITDNSGAFDHANIFPTAFYYDDIDDVGVGELDPYGILFYYPVVSRVGRGDMMFDGTPFYSFDADDVAHGAVEASGISDYTSVFVVPLIDVECKTIGTIPFEELVPPS